MKFPRLLAALLASVPFVMSHAGLPPDTDSIVEVSNDNPNRIVCENGEINDIVIPSHIPHDVQISGQNAFLVYMMLPEATGDVQYVDKKHDIHVVCDAQVYTLHITPINRLSRTVRLGDSDKKEIETNAKKLQEMSMEDVMIEMFFNAYTNELPPNYAVTELKDAAFVDLGAGLRALPKRSAALHGIGLSIKEFEVTSPKEVVLYKQMFMRKEISQALRMVAVVPDRIATGEVARLFIVEDK